MGEMADYFLESVIEEEYQRDRYATGGMDIYEAYERGFLDSSGCEQEGIPEAYERNGIPTQEYLDNELKYALKDLELATQERKDNLPYTPKYSVEEIITTLEKLGYKVLKIDSQSATILNKEATNNLQFDVPTCNVCREFMIPQEGKFGKFYYCGNHCEGQKTVSDKYWQSVRVK